MSNFLTRPLPEFVRYAAFGSLAIFVFGVKFYNANFKSLTGTRPVVAQRTTEPFHVQAKCPSHLFPKDLTLIHRDMSYHELSTSLGLKLSADAEKKIEDVQIQDKRFVNIWYQNPAKDTLEVRMHDGRVLKARFVPRNEVTSYESSKEETS